MASIFHQRLASTLVDALPTPRGHVIVVHADEQPLQGFQTLLDNHILSAPVYDDSTGKYIGFLDIRDLVSFCVFINDNNNETSNLTDLVNYGVKMFKHAVDGVTITYLSKRNPFHSVNKGSSLKEAVDLLSRGLRRVPVVDEHGKVINIISQSTLVQFMNAHIEDFKATANKRVSELDIGSSNVLSVKKDDSAINVFRILETHGRSGVAVVDAHGVLVGNTSGQDLKLFVKTPSLSLLQIPIMDFLKQIRSMSVDIMAPVITCKPTDSFAMVIAKLAATKVHRLFVTDDDFKPLKVISITDVLKALDK